MKETTHVSDNHTIHQPRRDPARAILTVVAALLGVAVVGLVLAWIWVGDGRFGLSALVVAVVAIVVAAVASSCGEERQP